MQYSVWYLTWHILIFYLIYILTFDWHSQIGRNNMKTKTHTMSSPLHKHPMAVTGWWRVLYRINPIWTYKAVVTLKFVVLAETHQSRLLGPIVMTGFDAKYPIRANSKNPWSRYLRFFFHHSSISRPNKACLVALQLLKQMFFSCCIQWQWHISCYIYSMSPIYIYIYHP